MPDPSRVLTVSVGPLTALKPSLILSLDRTDAAGAASFVAAVAQMIAEELARRDGQTFDHPLAMTLGPVSEERAAELRAAWERAR